MLNEERLRQKAASIIRAYGFVSTAESLKRYFDRIDTRISHERDYIASRLDTMTQEDLSSILVPIKQIGELAERVARLFYNKIKVMNARLPREYPEQALQLRRFAFKWLKEYNARPKYITNLLVAIINSIDDLKRRPNEHDLKKFITSSHALEGHILDIFSDILTPRILMEKDLARALAGKNPL